MPLSYDFMTQVTTLQIVATKSGLGAYLIQQNQPVAYASRAMSSSEINYAQIGKELFAILYGCKRLNMYTNGAEIKVPSDHKPLKNISKKPLFKACKEWDFVCKSIILKWDMFHGSYIADTLSQPIPGTSKEE